MSTWLWVIAGGVGFLVLSVAVSLAVASLFGRIARQEEADLLEAELWSIASLTRAHLEEEAGGSAQEAAVERGERVRAPPSSSRR